MLKTLPVRPSWSRYFLDLAKTVASRATCLRGAVGSVLVRDKVIIATGYNGSISGTPHCTEVGCLMRDNHCVRTIHSEQNSVAQAAQRGISLEGSELYVTCIPCWSCFKLLVNAGVKEFYYDSDYQVDPQVLSTAEALKLRFIKLPHDI